MTMTRLPADLTITRRDFEECPWQTALANCPREDYVSMHSAFSDAARKALDEGRATQGKVLWLLSDACSMMLKPDCRSEPFAPLMVMNGRRSAIADDFTDSDLDFFLEILDGIGNARLRGRIADVLWVRRRMLGTRVALLAVDAYRSVPLDLDSWLRDGDDCWKRAFSLTRLLRTAAGDRLQEMENTILGSFDQTTVSDGFLALWMAELLAENHLGGKHQDEISAKLEAFGVAFQSSSDLHRAREYFRGSVNWFKSAGNSSKAYEITAMLAETWVKAAGDRLASADPGHMVAAGFYESAIQVYREIPRRERATYRVDERVEELRELMQVSGEMALGEMRGFASNSIDITQIVESAQDAVGGKELLPALLAFTNHAQIARVDQLRTNAEKTLRNFPLQALFASTHVASDGRVIARSQGSNGDQVDSEDHRSALWSQMLREYGIALGLSVQGQILPGLDVLVREHRLRLDDFIQVAANSPIVPPGRERLFGSALHAGFEGNFGVAIHMLTPQIENMVRFHLKNAGAKTTNLDQQGIENEVGLSALMEMPEIDSIFGKDLAFEIKALFCDAIGPNLRNEIAHGLLDDSVYLSVHAVYAWWLALKLAFNTFWNRARKGGASSEGEAETTNEAKSGMGTGELE